MKNSVIALSLALLIPFYSCKKESNEKELNPKEIKLPSKASEVIIKSNDFGITLFKKTASMEEGNMMISPLSASVALTMLLNGCENNTYKQIQEVLGFEGLTTPEINETYKSLVEQLLKADPDVKLAIANSIWYRQDFQVKSSYINSMLTDYTAHVEALNFDLPSALITMNQWANDNTFGKIPKVLDEISPEAVMFLMNALYFKGTWTYQFDKTKTYTEDFFKEDNSTVGVDMMHITLNANVYSNTICKVVELNYGRTNYSMIVIVPSGKLNDFHTTFNNEIWVDITNSLGSTETPIEWNVSLPKFKFSYEKVLNNQLRSLGMIDAFDSEIADLSGISDTGIFVSFVKQNTFVEVNEEGTEAAAVTVIGVELTSSREDSPSFIVNKPFIFIIRERTTNSILFMGKVVDPTL